MSGFLGAIGQGFRSSTILRQVAKRFPKYAPYIQGAMYAGFTPHRILKRLSSSGPVYDQAEEYLTAEEKAAKRKKEVQRTAGNRILGTAGVLGGLYSLLNDQLGQQPLEEQPQPEKLEQPQEFKKTEGLDPLRPPGPQERPKNIFEGEMPPLPVGAEEKDYPHLTDIATKALEGGMSPETLYEGLKKSKFNGPLIDAVEQKQGKPFLENIKSLQARLQQPQQKMPDAMAQEPMKEEAPFKPSVGSKVILPNGQIGEVSHTKDTHGLINVNGRKESAPLADLEQVPPEWENIHVDLSKIPESERSAPLNFVAASPDKKHIFVRFWDWGDKEPKFYEYSTKNGEPFDDQTIESITTETDVPVTEGMEFTGSWSGKGKSRGSGFHHRLKILAQSDEDEDNPDMPFVYRSVPIKYEHGFMRAAFKEFKEARKKFNVIHKPPKRKRRSD